MEAHQQANMAVCLLRNMAGYQQPNMVDFRRPQAVVCQLHQLPLIEAIFRLGRTFLESWKRDGIIKRLS